MQDNKKNYLMSLLSWADELEQKVSQIDVDESELKEWHNQINHWKTIINEKLDQADSISDDTIYDIQDRSQNLVDMLEETIANPRNKKDRLPPGEHQLPPLPYAYNALEPYIAEEIMRLHHKEHHQSYVDGLNKAEKELYGKKVDPNLLKHWMREQAFHGSGHYLHTIFWGNMSPKGGGTPGQVLLSQIRKDFGSFKNFQLLFTKAAESVEGVGWAILVWQPRAGRLGIQTVEKHQMFSLWDSIPLLVLDVWEHAYYLQYQNNRSNYIDNWWNVVHWPDVSERFQQANKLVWPLY
ncbi:superoxide dismutase [Aquibacillus koreensis]|uniref:superoxide dismutase n=1 Tax=Aquibacillus koreensis TaxID=279446 RepID=A0A9X3WKB4_9BACI|nr:Fe-Mn family superoxide dismutase [Aquibacillus koreensis]MCT2537433.1 superoxide dismutase [Aquibacillus koreensis]MDC3418879.1 superoxide dismutase [Aquibacillus koreensis]